MASLLILSSEFPPFRGGIGTYAYELAKAAAAAGHDVTVVAPDFFSATAEVDQTCDFEIIRFRGGAASFRSLPDRLRVTSRVLRRRNFDIIHAVDWPFFIPARLFAPRSSRVLLTLHGTEISYMSHRKRLAVLGLLRFWRTGWAEWIANSRYTMQNALDILPIEPGAIRAVPLGVSDEWLLNRTCRKDARTELQIADDRLILLSLGRVVARKGHGVLAEALALLPAELSERVSWWIVGPLQEPAHADLIRAKLAQAGVDGTFFGALPAEQVKTRLAASDLFCLPGFVDDGGRVEGFGLVFLEAAAYGVASVATLSGGIPEAIDDGVTGLLVPEKDPVALVAALRKLLENDELRNHMATAARARAERSTWHAVMQQTYS